MALLLLVSCGESVREMDQQERKNLSVSLFQEYFEGHSHFPSQGSPAAMTLLDSILGLDPTNAAAWREKGVPYLKRGLPHQWKPLFDKAIEHDATTWQPYRGYLYLTFYRDYAKAIGDFNASDTLTDYLDYPQGHSVDYWRGIAYLGMKDFNNSIAFWDKHIKKETEDNGEDWVELNAFLYRGIAYFESGNREKAIENFDKVIKYFKQSADAKYYKAMLLKEMGKGKEAKRMVEDAITDFNAGYFNNEYYYEVLRQIYLEDLIVLKESL